MKVRTPLGSTYRVTRRWVPWRRRLKGTLDSVPDLPALGDDPISAIVSLIFLVILIPFVLLALVAGLELLLVLLVLPFAILGRVLLGRHWTVEVRAGWRPIWEEQAGSWADSGERIAAVAAQIEEGRVPQGNLGNDGAAERYHRQRQRDLDRRAAERGERPEQPGTGRD